MRPRTRSPASTYCEVSRARILLSPQHEPILRAVATCLNMATGSGVENATTQPTTRPQPCALLTYQVHDRCQESKQKAFFDLAPKFGITPSRLLTVNVGKQFDEEESEEEEEAPNSSEDVTTLVQLWELRSASGQAHT